MLLRKTEISEWRTTHGPTYAQKMAARSDVRDLTKAILLLDTTDLRTRADKGSA